MSRVRYHNLSVLLVSFFFFAFASSAYAQTPCGDFVAINTDGGEVSEYRWPIEDCANPFNADDPVPFSASLKLNTQMVQDNTVITIPAAGPIEGEFAISDVQSDFNNFISEPLELYRKVGNDYYLELYIGDETFTANDLPEGEYTAVFSFQEPPVLNQNRPLWLEIISNIFLPHTVYASAATDLKQTVIISFTIEHEAPPPLGASSVLFLPGIQSSRLYTKNGNDVNQLWEPNINADVEKLAMTALGESVNIVYTEDVLNKIFGVIDVYQTFLDQLKDLKQTEIIKDYEAFAYDWRYSVFDVATQEVAYPDGETKRLVDEVKHLANDSYTGKVTLIGHSNGGLVAKALLSEYGETELAGKVDKLVMIGTPQLGTPKAIGVMLHGLGQQKGLGVLIDQGTARTVIRDMPGAYTLLPSAKYFTETGDVVVSADSSSVASSVKDYGDVVTETELHAFLRDSLNLRADAVPLNEPSTLNGDFLDTASSYQDTLDNWHAPVGVSVYEVVGTGVATIKGFEYREFGCKASPFCVLDSYVKPFPLFTNQGDETVVAKSASGYGGDKTTAYVDLKKESAGILNKNIEHANLTESDSVQVFVGSIIRYPYIGDTIIIPAFTEASTKYTIIGGHSPVSLLATDSKGNQLGIVSGEIKEDIRGSQYLELGESKYLIIPSSEDVTVEVRGTGNGVYSLTVDELGTNNQQKELSLLSRASTTPQMRAVFSVKAGVFSPLETDIDGNGTIDLKQTLNGEIIKEPLKYNYNNLTLAIKSLNLSKAQIKVLLVEVELAEFFNKKSAKNRVFKTLEKGTLEAVLQSVTFYNKKGKISTEELRNLEKIINYLIKV